MMGKAELILPRIPEKHSLIQGNEKAKSRKEIVEERIRKRRAELKAVCPPSKMILILNFISNNLHIIIVDYFTL